MLEKKALGAVVNWDNTKRLYMACNTFWSCLMTLIKRASTHIVRVACGESGSVCCQMMVSSLDNLDAQDAQSILTVSNAEKAYKYFIQALKMDPEFAPAFTSLGIYYLELASPPDPIRSSKCFQKAFELDARETLAARRLVEGFTTDKEWDLVEVIAQRTIDGEGGLNAGLDKSELDASTRYLPTNAWAWKAIGVVKFVGTLFSNQNFCVLNN